MVKKKSYAPLEEIIYEAPTETKVLEEVEAPTETKVSEEVEVYTKKIHSIRSELVLSNPSNIRRGISLRKGIVFLNPGEVKRIPEHLEEEVRALFRNKTMQKIVDAGLLRFSDDVGEELVSQKTIEAPSELTSSVQVGTTGMFVGSNSTTKFDPNSNSPLRADGTVSL